MLRIGWFITWIGLLVGKGESFEMSLSVGITKGIMMIVDNDIVVSIVTDLNNYFSYHNYCYFYCYDYKTAV